MSCPTELIAPNAVTINDAYPWGRSFEEYRRMFALTHANLRGRIIGCADGPAAFNAAMARRRVRVVSCDPLYGFSANQIRARIDVTRDRLILETRAAADRFVWDRIPSPEDLGRVRMAAMDEFLADYDAGRREGRYLAMSLPSLALPDDAFDLALCSHFLLLYSRELTLQFHVRSVQGMCRLAPEARMFPLLDREGRRSPHLEPLIDALRDAGLEASVERVDYEFQRGGNEMLRVRRTTSEF